MATAEPNKSLISGIVLAFVLWFVVFVIRPINFWLMMSINTTVLATLSFLYGRPLITRDEWTVKNVFLGFVLAFVLYGVFWSGNQILSLLSHAIPGFLPNRADNISEVYANRGALPRGIVGVLLFFPIGFGEEVFWRGFIQRQFWQKRSGISAFLITTLLYTLVHLPTGNPVLILAALVCGLFWGSIFWATGSLLPVLISHMIWDPMIFILFPLK